jgi:glycosyltransferase involved in cell wall biosynthesis
VDVTPEFSLICATIGRTSELDRLLESLTGQTYRRFNVIVVDQNEDDRLAPVIERHAERIPIRHVRCGPGVSRARNAGLPLASGNIIGFPDDDCWYAEDLLERVARFFDDHPDIDMLTGAARDAGGEPVGRWDEQAGPLTRTNVWRRGIAFSMFLRASAVRRAGTFDERLGVGSGTPFGSAEETDYLIRALDEGCSSFYDPELVVYHPNKKYTEFGIARAFAYGAGMGYVLRLRRCAPREVGELLARPLLGAGLFFASGHMRRGNYQLSTFRGRLWGYTHALRFAASAGR